MGLNPGCSPPLQATHSPSHDLRKNGGGGEACSGLWWLGPGGTFGGGFCCLSHSWVTAGCAGDDRLGKSGPESRHRKPVQGHVYGEV